MSIESVMKDIKKAQHDTTVVQILTELIVVLYEKGDTKKNLREYIDNKEKELGI